MKFKQFDKVTLKYTNEKGYIDTVVGDRYVVRLSTGCYKWVEKWQIELQDQKMDINKPTEMSKEIKNMLGW